MYNHSFLNFINLFRHQNQYVYFPLIFLLFYYYIVIINFHKNLIYHLLIHLIPYCFSLIYHIHLIYSLFILYSNFINFYNYYCYHLFFNFILIFLFLFIIKFNQNLSLLKLILQIYIIF
jgi:hypothetical protein